MTFGSTLGVMYVCINERHELHENIYMASRAAVHVRVEMRFLINSRSNFANW